MSGRCCYLTESSGLFSVFGFLEILNERVAVPITTLTLLTLFYSKYFVFIRFRCLWHMSNVLHIWEKITWIVALSQGTNFIFEISGFKYTNNVGRKSLAGMTAAQYECSFRYFINSVYGMCPEYFKTTRKLLQLQITSLRLSWICSTEIEIYDLALMNAIWIFVKIVNSGPWMGFSATFFKFRLPRLSEDDSQVNFGLFVELLDFLLR